MRKSGGVGLRWAAALLMGVGAVGVGACALEAAPSATVALAKVSPWLPAGLPFVIGLVAASIAWRTGRASGSDRTTLRLHQLRWSRNDFCRGWYISGATGCGKTEAIKLVLHQLCQSEPDWGGLFIDEKGFFVDEVIPILRHYGRGGDVCELRGRPDDAPPNWAPPFRFNILGDERVRTSQYVDAILMAAEAVASGKEDKGFFKTQAGLHIGAAIDLFRGLREWQRQTGVAEKAWVAPTLRGVYEILTSEDDFQRLVKDRVKLFVEVRPPGTDDSSEKVFEPNFRGVMPPLLIQALEHFNKRYWNVRAQEQMEGVKGTITNYLRWFTDDAIHEVFGAEDANFTIRCMDEGKMICVSLPQRYAIERRCICALLKVLAYAHARARVPTQRDYNLMVIWQDEAQRFIMPVDGEVDILRQFQVTTVIATQFRAQLESALGGKEKAQPIIGNLRNRIILQAADEDCAEESAKFIGRGLRRKRSVTRQGSSSRSTSMSEEVAYSVEPYQLRKLPKFVGVFCHAAGDWRIWQFSPIDERRRIPNWFSALALPEMKWKLFLSSDGPKYCGFTPPKVYVR